MKPRRQVFPQHSPINMAHSLQPVFKPVHLLQGKQCKSSWSRWLHQKQVNSKNPSGENFLHICDYSDILNTINENFWYLPQRKYLLFTKQYTQRVATQNPFQNSMNFYEIFPDFRPFSSLFLMANLAIFIHGQFEKSYKYLWLLI